MTVSQYILSSFMIWVLMLIRCVVLCGNNWHAFLHTELNLESGPDITGLYILGC